MHSRFTVFDNRRRHIFGNCIEHVTYTVPNTLLYFMTIHNLASAEFLSHIRWCHVTLHTCSEMWVANLPVGKSAPIYLPLWGTCWLVALTHSKYRALLASKHAAPLRVMPAIRLRISTTISALGWYTKRL